MKTNFISRMAICALFSFFATSNLMAQASYIRNGNCENKTGWAYNLKTATSVSLVYEDVAGNDGSSAVKCVSVIPAGKFCVVVLLDSILIPKEVETKLSFWAKSSVANGRVLPTTQAVESSVLPVGVTKYPFKDISDELIPTEWKKYEFTYTTQSTVGYYSQIKFRNYISGTLWIDNVQWGDATSTGISSLENKISIYPNPTTEMIYIDGVSNQTNLKVYNATGVLVANGTGTKINVSTLLAGYYILVPDNKASISFVKK